MPTEIAHLELMQQFVRRILELENEVSEQQAELETLRLDGALHVDKIEKLQRHIVNLQKVIRDVTYEKYILENELDNLRGY